MGISRADNLLGQKINIDDCGGICLLYTSDAADE